MTRASHTLFRDQAIQHSIHRRQQDVLPRLVSPPVAVCCWILLGFLLLAGGLAWWEEIPTYLEGVGILLPATAGHNQAQALVFLPTTHPFQLRTGLPIHLQIGATGTGGSGQLEQLEPGILSPLEARQRYALGGTLAQLITQPSLVVLVSVGPPLSARMYAGSVVSAQVQSGARRVLSLVPGLANFIGG